MAMLGEPGRRTSRLEVLLGVLTCAAASVLAGCERRTDEAPSGFSTPSALDGFNRPRSGEAFALGEEARAPELAMTVEATKLCDAEHLKRGNVLFGAEVSIAGRARDEVHFNPFHCKLHDEAGSTYTPTFNGCEPRLRDHRLARDDEASGWVSFEVPGRAKSLRLVCTQAVPGREERVLEFDVGRGL